MDEYEHLTDAQWDLCDRMSAICEDSYCAGWLGDCEYDIWHALHHEDPWAPNRSMNSRLLRLCQKLSTEIGGWIYWADGPQFAPMAQWLEMVEARRNQSATVLSTKMPFISNNGIKWQLFKKCINKP